MNLNASNGRAGRPLRNWSHPTFCAVQSEGTARTHWPFGDAFPGVGEGARALVLEPDLDHPVRLLRRGAARLRLRDGPGHGLLGVEVLPRRHGVEEVARV